MTAYVETTIPSYLTAWPSRDVVRAGEQQLTHDWWARRDEYELRVSSLVLLECGAGDPTAAAARLAALDGIPVLAQTTEADSLAAALLREVPLPARAASDAFHIAVAAVNGVAYLVTWNCTHIANATLRPRIEAVCRQAGYEPPVICTPQELLGGESGNHERSETYWWSYGRGGMSSPAPTGTTSRRWGRCSASWMHRCRGAGRAW